MADRNGNEWPLAGRGKTLPSRLSGKPETSFAALATGLWRGGGDLAFVDISIHDADEGAATGHFVPHRGVATAFVGVKLDSHGVGIEAVEEDVDLDRQKN